MKWAQLLIFGTIGIALLALGTLWGLEAYSGFHDKVSTPGTVVDFVADHSGKHPDAIIPVIEFVAVNNAKVRFQADAVSFNAPGFEKGSIVNVLYDPNNTANAHAGNYMQLWQGPLLTGAIGLVLILLSLVLFMKIGQFERSLRGLGSEKKIPPSPNPLPKGRGQEKE